MTPQSPVPINPSVPSELRDVVRAGVRAAKEVPGSIALGGTVCALYAGHRLSIDVDFVLTDLDRRFEHVREHLLNVSGWTENRVRAPVLILGCLDGVEIGYRQLRRRSPIETVAVKTEDGELLVPTIEELLRIKAFLAYDRNYVRDYVDFAELAAFFGDGNTVAALGVLDEKFGWQKQPLVLDEVIKALLLCRPRDLEARGYESLRWLNPRLHSWEEAEAFCKAIGQKLAVREIIEEQKP